MMTHLFCMLRVALIFHLFCMSKALEFIVNPLSSTISCGTNDNCTVICNTTQSCKDKSFYFYNHSIDIHCSAQDACRSAKIFTSNVQSFTANMTGYYSFGTGRLYTSKTDTDVHVQCGPGHGSDLNLQTCSGAHFYYLNHGQSTHTCWGSMTCRMSMIHGISAVTLICKGPWAAKPCMRTSFVLSSDEQQNQQSSLVVYEGYADQVGTMRVYSLYPFTNFSSADGIALNDIHFIYGMRFNQYCIVSDTLCMNAVPNNTDSYDHLTIIH
eukprot:953550_1